MVASSLLEFALAGLGTVAAESLASGEIPGLLGTHSPTFAPYGGFQTADGWLVMAGAGSEDLWQRACRALGVEALIDDPRFADNAARVGRRDELSELIEKSLSTDTTERWLERLAAAGVPAARVQDLGAVLDSEQVAALGMIQHLDHHQAGRYAVPRAPIRFGGQPARYPGPAPMLGAGHQGRPRRAGDGAGRDRGPVGRGRGGRAVNGSLAMLAAGVLRRTAELAVIPAPTGEEAERAALVSNWWRGDGWSGAQIDGAGNVWAQVRSGPGPAVVLCAHLDTVFGRDVDHRVRIEGDRLYGPGVGDNAVAVAALSAVGQLVAENVSSGSPVWILATVAEEGLGNLAGVRWALDHPIADLGAMVALEGNYLGRIGATAVGSVRWRVEIEGPGGHAWEAAATPSASTRRERLSPPWPRSRSFPEARPSTSAP